MTDRRPRLPPLILLLLLTMGIISAGGALWLAGDQGARAVAREMQRFFDQVAATVEVLIASRLDQVADQVAEVGRDPALVASLTGAGGSAAAHLWAAFDNAAANGIDFLTLRDAGGRRVARVVQPVLDIDRAVAALPFRPDRVGTWALTRLDSGHWAILDRQHVVDPATGAVIGTVTGGLILDDNPALFARLRTLTGARAIALSLDGRLLRPHAIGDPGRREAMADAAVSGIPRRHGGEIVGAVPVTVPGDGPRLDLVLAVPDDRIGHLAETLRTVAVEVLLLVLASATLATVLLSHIIGRELRRLLRFGERAAADPAAHWRGSPINEFHRLGRALAGMVASLQDREAHLRSLFRAAGAPILVWNTDLEIRDHNDAAAALLDGDARGRRLDAVLPEPVAEQLAAITARGAMATLEFVLAGRYLAWTLAPVTASDGQVVAVVAQGQDLTARRDMEQQLEQSHADLERFAAATSHDLREPLRQIAIFINLLEQQYAERLDPRGREFLGFIGSGARRMQRMVASLLAFTHDHASAGQQAVDLDALIRELWVDLAPPAEAGLEIPAPLPTLPGNGERLRLLFEHVLDNALRYRAPERPPRIAVTAKRVAGCWDIRVADNGIGLAKGEEERIFGAFTRGQSGHPEAAGVGLALCRRIAEDHGGRIHATSDGPTGTTFHIHLPAYSDKCPL